ncbi:MAG: hypothetical protein ACRCXM_09145 [Beijerinckiaceae bacterium]
MSDLQSTESEQERQLADEVQRVATGYINDAFAEARAIGLEGDTMAHAALCAALRELVATYGEEPVAVFADGLAEKIRHGRYTEAARH